MELHIVSAAAKNAAQAMMRYMEQITGTDGGYDCSFPR